MILEARCLSCRETFNPTNDLDMEHAIRENGTECGGEGELIAAYG